MKIKPYIICILPLFLIGCASVQTTVLPKSNGRYEVVATASSASDALSGAMSKANDICDQTNQKVVVVHDSSKYDGAFSKKTTATVDAATRVVNDVNFSQGKAGIFPDPIDNSHNYKVNLVFKCQ